MEIIIATKYRRFYNKKTKLSLKEKKEKINNLQNKK